MSFFWKTKKDLIACRDNLNNCLGLNNLHGGIKLKKKNLKSNFFFFFFKRGATTIS